jgi:hypothetical protein
MVTVSFKKNMFQLAVPSKRALISVIVASLALLSSVSSYAETQLEATVDRTKVYEFDTISLQITGNVDMDFSIGGLMSFGRNQLEPPTLEGLEDDFEILDRKQNYSMQSINGDTKANVTWNYSLAPKKTGLLTIPSARYKSATTNTISITVLPGKQPHNSDTPPNVFLEVEVDKSSVYVQEQVIYTVRLFSAGRLSNGNMSEPESTDAVIEAFGETTKYYRMAYSQRYEVIERQYLVFPQKSGSLTIPELFAQGMMIDNKRRRQVRIREQSDAVNITVLPPPDNFTGDFWLPATSLNISEKWQGDTNSLLEGDSITRTISLSALGLLGSALPPINLADIEGIKVYPDQAKTDSLQHENGAQSTRVESAAFVAINVAEIEIPEISIPWWDTVNNIERVASIPAQRLVVNPNPALNKPPEVPGSPLHSETEQANKPSLADKNSDLSEASIANTQNNIAQNSQGWYIIVTLILVAWASTSWLLLTRIQRQNRQIKQQNATSAVQLRSNNDLLKSLYAAIDAKHIDMPKLLVQWLQASQANNLKVTSIQDLKQFNHSLYDQVKAFEANHYSANSNNDYCAKTLRASIKEIVNRASKAPKAADLKPLYP